MLQSFIVQRFTGLWNGSRKRMELFREKRWQKGEMLGCAGSKFPSLRGRRDTNQ